VPLPCRAPRRLTIDEAAARLGTTPRTIWRWADKGDLTFERPSPGRTFVTEDSVARLERRRARAARDVSRETGGAGGAGVADEVGP
jgi:excisionase family DNA binding protein